MKKLISDVQGAQQLSKKEQKTIHGEGLSIGCGGDGSFIYVNGRRVCCYQPWSGQYIC